MTLKISTQLIGQSGCILKYENIVLYVDPYLSNSVQELDSPDLERLIDIPIAPEDITDADFVLITHDHIDHCDPHTIPKIAKASKKCQFIGPPPVLEKLKKWGISKQRLHLSEESGFEIGSKIKIYAVPAAHPKIIRNKERYLLSVGYIVEIEGKRLYLAGDTVVTEELIKDLNQYLPISAAILPVNEHNYFLGRRGIIGNMSAREAFLFADEIKVNTVIPVHWDMFAANAVDLDEIKIIYSNMNPKFNLKIQPTEILL